MDENGIGEAVIGCAIRVHRALGPGLLENAYEACLTHEITKTGLSCQRQIVLPIIYDGQKIEAGYRLDLLVDRRVVVEVKAVEMLVDIHRAQLLKLSQTWRLPSGLSVEFQCFQNERWRQPDGEWSLT